MSPFEFVVGVIVDLIKHFDSKEIAFAFAFGILGSGIGIWIAFVWRPHHRFIRALKRATAAVRAAAYNTAWRSDDKLAAVDEAIKSNAVLGEVWVPYRAALRADPEREGGYLNPVDPHAWFALDRLPGRGYEKWASTLAGVSLTVGLLFTFVGLSAGA